MRTSLAQRRFLHRFLWSASLAMFSIGLRSCLFQGVFVVVGIQCLVAFEYADLLIRNRRASDKDKDAAACRELREEYRNECSRRPDLKQSNEFCVAFENVCFQIHESDPDQPVGISRQIGSTERPVVASTKRDYSQFCQEYKQRFLYVCPDPFRFGQRAAVFCPVYSERCNVPIPEKPVTPTDRPNVIGIQQSTQRICAQFRNFAVGYCNNPFALAQPNVAKGCEKYRSLHKVSDSFMGKMILFVVMLFPFLLINVDSQAPYYPNHYYGESSADIASHKVPPRERWPEPRKDPLKATLAPHVCGFNPYTRECMDPENYCPGRCINFNYIYNARYDCRCLVV